MAALVYIQDHLTGVILALRPVLKKETATFEQWKRLSYQEKR